MRDEFVGILFAVATFLVLYKGFTVFEDYALNLAGIFLVGVALFPMEWGCGDSCSKFTLHYICAVLFFLSIAYVCIFRASDTLRLIPDKTKVDHYKRAYKIIGVGMVVSPALAIVLSFILQPHSTARATVFFVEAVAVFIFAIYWIVKSVEIHQSNSERSALEGKLTAGPVRMTDMFKEISVARIEPSREGTVDPSVTAT